MNTINLTKGGFLRKVANYLANPNEWKFLGERPALIDFMLRGADLANSCLRYLMSWRRSMRDGWIYIK